MNKITKTDLLTVLCKVSKYNLQKMLYIVINSVKKFNDKDDKIIDLELKNYLGIDYLFEMLKDTFNHYFEVNQTKFVINLMEEIKKESEK